MRCQIQFFNQWCEYKKKSFHVWCEKAGGPISSFIYFYLSCKLLKKQNQTLFMENSTMNVTILDPIFEHKTPELICHMLWSLWAMDITFIRLLLGPKSHDNANTDPDKTCLLMWSLVQFLTTDTRENTKRKAAVSAAVTDHCTSNMQSQSDAKDKLTDGGRDTPLRGFDLYTFSRLIEYGAYYRFWCAHWPWCETENQIRNEIRGHRS